MILNVALDTPLRRCFDYLPPIAGLERPPRPGVRVRVPFGRRQLVGILLAVSERSEIAAGKLKAAVEILDHEPIFDPVTLELLHWAADYYHHPIGEVMAAALPASLRAGAPKEILQQRWSLTDAGRAELARTTRRAPRRRALLAWLAENAPAWTTELPEEFGSSDLSRLAANGWAVAAHLAFETGAVALEERASEVPLTAAQSAVVATLKDSLGSFTAHLLYGVTGSGKTEVYLRAIAAAIANGGQALVLVPEIALTPQLVLRFRSRFSTGVVVMHSALTPASRRDAWRAARTGEARIVIGTRSAVFTSLEHLALIVVDEEHDASYKQHEGFRYSARDLAVLRAQQARVPIVLGSATPSLETLENVVQARYSRLSLPTRVGSAGPPRMQLIDLRRHACEQGISQPALTAMRQHLRRGGQVIVFLNRRGYAPSLYCNACAWVALCDHCDARLTLHRRAHELRCHHCGAHREVPTLCPTCAKPVNPLGQGTERVEDTLTRLFPEAPLARLDRDTAQAPAALETTLERVRRGEARILVGTQMLTKGHDFPDVSLVVILDADQGLFSSDFRATERLAQLITQVAGRAGRAERAGEVMIQTSYPEHPLLTRLITQGYESFAEVALEERRQAGWPPFARLALLRAEAKNVEALNDFLERAARAGRAAAEDQVTVQGPASALMARRADHFRAHLLVEAKARAPLQRFLKRWLPMVEALPGIAALRWSIDVDPLELD